MKINQKILFVSWAVCFALFIPNCNNKDGSVTSPLSPAHTPPPPHQPHLETSGYFYGNSFQVQNFDLYEKLLENCKRCGTRRLIRNPAGGVTYEKHLTFKNNPKRCSNWVSRGYIQIEFAKKQLPAEVTVSIQPRLTTRDFWGEPFELKAMANPINNKSGFQILLTPRDGLGGSFALDIISERTQPEKQNSLDITATYGEHSIPIFQQSLPLLKQRSVRKSVAGCDTYTN